MKEEKTEKKRNKRRKLSNSYNNKRHRIWARKKRAEAKKEAKEKRHEELVAAGMPEPGTKEFYVWIAKRERIPSSEWKRKPKKKKKKSKPKKKRVGRPRKPGRKRKYYYYIKVADRVKKIECSGANGRNRMDWKVAECHNGTEIVNHGGYKHKEDALAVYERVKEEKMPCDFPCRLTVKARRLIDTDNQILLLKRDWVGDEESIADRNEYGKVIRQDIKVVGRAKNLGRRWVVFDQFKFDTEEQFNVMGYDPIDDRKTFRWIYENIICKDVGLYEVRRVIKYKMFVAIIGEDGHNGWITCKSSADAARFYSTLGEWAKRDKLEWLCFIGAADGSRTKIRKLREEFGLIGKKLY